MRSGRTAFLKIAFALSGAAALPFLHAADSASVPAPAGAPEKIEFSSPASSTAPKIPRPGVKNEQLIDRYGNVRESAPQGVDFGTPMTPTTVLPTKAAAEKMLREWDRKKNWAVPHEDESKEKDPLSKTEEKPDESLGTEKRDSVMQRFLTGDSRKNTTTQTHLRGEFSSERDRQDTRRGELDSKGRNSKFDERDRDDDRRDPNDSADANGLAEFNLKNFIRQQNGMPTFVKDNQLPRASQLFRSDIGNMPDTQRLEKREREQRDTRSAEFMQMLKPRTTTGFAGPSDPINSPDFTRREFNPITPRTAEPTEASRSPFTAPPASPASRIQENNLLGVTGPAAASMAPTFSAPPPQATPQVRSRDIVIEPPKRPF